MTEEKRTEIEFELQDIINLLPSDHPEGEKRKHNLTRHDLILIAKLIEMKNKSCPIDLTKEQEVILKRMLNAVSSGVSLVALLIVTSIVGIAITLLTKGFWVLVKSKVGG